MQQHTSLQAVQAMACEALGELALSQSSCQLNAFVTAGVIECIVAAMQQHAAVASVQQKACIALKSSSQVSGERVVAAGGIECLLSAMQQHGGATIQDNACEVLFGLVQQDMQRVGWNEGSRARIAQARGIECIVSAMKRHSSRSEQFEGMRRHGSGVLALMALSHNSYRVRLEEADGVELVKSGLQQNHSMQITLRRFNEQTDSMRRTLSRGNGRAMFGVLSLSSPRATFLVHA